jgi:hypothetical protein
VGGFHELALLVEDADADAKTPGKIADRHPAPRGQVGLHGAVDGAKLEEATARQRIHVLADEQQEPVAAVEVSPVSRQARTDAR